MLSKVFTATLATALVVAVSAAPGDYTSQCNGGTVQCCNQVQSAESLDSRLIGFLSSVGVVASSIQGLVGAECTPVTAIGVGSGASCSQQQVCCANTYSNGLVAANCNPVNVHA